LPFHKITYAAIKETAKVCIPNPNPKTVNTIKTNPTS